VPSPRKQSKQRHARDFYSTPAWCTHRLWDAIGSPVNIDRMAHILEPCVGTAAIPLATSEWMNQNPPPEKWSRDRWSSFPRAVGWTMCDLETDVPGACIGDFLFGLNGQGSLIDQLAIPQLARFDAVITNPPFSRAMDFVRRSLEHAPIVIMLLRMGWLGSDERAAWLRERTPSVYMLPDRPSFTADGATDSDYYAWMAWGLDPEPRFVILDSTPLAERKVSRMHDDPRQLGLAEKWTDEDPTMNARLAEKPDGAV